MFYGIDYDKKLCKIYVFSITVFLKSRECSKTYEEVYGLVCLTTSAHEDETKITITNLSTCLM